MIEEKPEVLSTRQILHYIFAVDVTMPMDMNGYSKDRTKARRGKCRACWFNERSDTGVSIFRGAHLTIYPIYLGLRPANRVI